MVMNTVDTEVDRLLAAGKDAAKQGDVASARSLLTQVVERDPHNEQAWMWLSGVVSEPEEQQICLENVLVVNPYNTKARKGLEFLSVKTGVPPNAPPVPTEFTAPLSSDLSAYTGAHDPWNQAAPVPGPGPMTGVGQPAPPTEAALPPWMQGSPQVAPSYPAPPPTSHEADADAARAAYDAFSADIFAEGTPAPGNGAAQDAWGNTVPSDNSLGIDWSKGLNPEPAPGSGPSFGGPQSGEQEWGGMDSFSQGQQPFGMAGMDGMDGAMPGWALDAPPGFQPLEPGSFNAGLAGGGAGGGAQGSDLAAMPQGGNFSPMGPAGDLQLPTPTDLPGYHAPTGDEPKPWYAQSSSGQQPTGSLRQGTGSLSGFDPNNPDELTQHLASGKSVPLVMVDCPNCGEQVADTALACPRCNFSFFVNCPHCHELVDAVDAKAGQTEPCPYCNTAIDKMKLGMANADPTASYVSIRLNKMEAAVPAMQQYMSAAAQKRGFSWAWVVDLMWLATVVIMVWVLTQLPTWLHWAGQYQ